MIATYGDYFYLHATRFIHLARSVKHLPGAAAARSGHLLLSLSEANRHVACTGSIPTSKEENHMALKPSTREHFDELLSLPHEDIAPVERAAWYAAEDDQVLAEIDFDPITERWVGVVYARSPAGWREVDGNGEGYFDLDDAERAVAAVAATLC
jgi:hypothetical protein